MKLLAWAGIKLGCKYATPIFDGASGSGTCNELKEAGIPEYGRFLSYTMV
jgi:DNA-directed RNA polymerase subunit beta